MIEIPLHTVQLIVDFGLVVLIWLVQLVIYPSFRFYSDQKLLKWHSVYTVRITYVVMPLMLLQLLFGFWNVLLSISFGSILYLLLIFLVWASTFLQFVPRHHKIAKNRFNHQLVADLTSKNWIRTFLWTLIFLIQLLFL